MRKKKVEEAVHSLKTEMGNISSELLKDGGEATTSLDSDMSEDLGDKGMDKGVDTIARHAFTIRLISHPNKIMLRFIFNRPKAKTGEPLVKFSHAVFGGFFSVEFCYHYRFWNFVLK